MKRVFDFFVALLAGLALAPVALVVGLAVLLTSRGPIIYWSQRVGQGNRLFFMPKFRTMKTGTPALATHMLTDARSRLTPIGGFLRRTSLDEIPQLWCVLLGQMSLVGPRPALFNQDDLIAERTRFGIERLQPGITGWAQVNGRDELSIREKTEFDRQYLERRSMSFDVYILFLTVFRLVGDKTVAH